jgi:threonine/homoserine/homoserine lactone efflux protein
MTDQALCHELPALLCVLLITFILVIVPGPIVTLVITTGATRGIRAALMTVLGSTLGNAVLITCIAFGLNWILRTSAEVFEILRWTGAAYLVWLGIQAWRHAGEQGEIAPPRHRVYVSRGFLVAMTNPRPSRSLRLSCRNSSIRSCPPATSWR